MRSPTPRTKGPLSAKISSGGSAPYLASAFPGRCNVVRSPALTLYPFTLPHALHAVTPHQYESDHTDPGNSLLIPCPPPVLRKVQGPVTVCLAFLGGALCPAPIRWVDPCGSGRFVIQHFNAADQVADVFYTIEIRIRDFHGGEGLLHSAYLFKRQQVGECHGALPIGPNALLHNQAIRSPVWRCFKIVKVLQERNCSPEQTRQKSLLTIWTHGLITTGLNYRLGMGLRLMQHRAEEPGIDQCPGCHRPLDAQTSGTYAQRAAWRPL